jgi:hypothetical protein
MRRRVGASGAYSVAAAKDYGEEYRAVGIRALPQ